MITVHLMNVDPCVMYFCTNPRQINVCRALFTLQMWKERRSKFRRLLDVPTEIDGAELNIGACEYTS